MSSSRPGVSMQAFLRRVLLAIIRQVLKDRQGAVATQRQVQAGRLWLLLSLCPGSSVTLDRWPNSAVSPVCVCKVRKECLPPIAAVVLSVTPIKFSQAAWQQPGLTGGQW